MRARTGWILAIGSAGLFLAGCGGSQTSSFTQPSFPQGNPTQGAKLFASTCASCHGPTANGVPGVGPSLRNRKAFGTLYKDQANLAKFIQIYMPRTNPGTLTPQQASNLASFIWGINGKMGKSTQDSLLSALGAAPTPPPPSSKPSSPSPAPSSAPSSSPPSSAALSAAQIAAGQKLYGQVCSVCHGNQGQGGAKMNAPALWGSNSLISKGSSMANLSALSQFIKSTMPVQTTNGVARGSLTQAQADDAAAFILHQNHLP